MIVVMVIFWAAVIVLVLGAIRCLACASPRSRFAAVGGRLASCHDPWLCSTAMAARICSTSRNTGGVVTRRTVPSAPTR